MRFWAFLCILAIGPSLTAQRPQRQVRQPESAEGNDWKDRAAWFLGQRIYPGTSIPPRARLEAFHQLESMKKSAKAREADAISATRWTYIGPRGVAYSGFLFANGRVGALAVDPRSVGDNRDIVYVGGTDGGVWKTTDSGATWTALTDDQPTLSIGSLAIDPTAPTTVYAGTGDPNSYPGVGILKSADGGQTWSHIPGPFSGAFIPSLAIHPVNTRILLAGSPSLGVFRSTDAGQTWANVVPAGVFAVAFNSTGSQAYAAASGNTSGTPPAFYKSTDGGITWRTSNGSGVTALPGGPVNNVTPLLVRMAVAPSDFNTVYLGIAGGANLFGLYKTTDGGQSWNALSRIPDYCTPQCTYSNRLSVHPSNPNIVFAGGIQLYRSLDGGTTWTHVGVDNFASNGQTYHVDQQAMDWTPNGARFYFGNDGGVWSSSSAAQPRIELTNLNGTLTLTQYCPGLAIHPTDINQAIGGTQDNGTERYSGDPMTEWVACGDGGWAVYDPTNPLTVFAACTKAQVLKSTDGGTTWAPTGQNIGGNAAFIAPLAIDPTNPQRVYFGTDAIYQTTNSGGTWSAITAPIAAGGPFTGLMVSPVDSTTVIAGTAIGKVFITTNAAAGSGSTWNDRTGSLPGRAITQVITDPLSATTFYALFSGFNSFTPSTPGHVFKSEGGGAWRDISGNLPDIPANDLAVDPDIPGTMYLGTDIGVFITTNGGTSWSALGTGFPNVAVMGLKLHRQSRTLRAATYGRGLWDLSVPSSNANALPVIASLSPQQAAAGSGTFTLTVSGTGFASGSVVQWNGAARTTTGTGTQLTASIPAADVAAAGVTRVTVFTPLPGGGVSNATSFVVGTSNPAPTLLSVLPGQIAVGTTSQTLTVTGTSFLGSSTVRWNGASRPFTLVSPTTLRIAGTAGDFSAGGLTTISVSNPAPGGGSSNVLSVLVVASTASSAVGGSPWLYTTASISATSAPLGAVTGVTFDVAGNPVVADTGNCYVYRLAGGNLNTLAGTGTCSGSGSFRFTAPTQTVVDRNGNVYAVDTFNMRVVKINPDGSLTTVAGSNTLGYSGDGGPATAAQLNIPMGIATDNSGNLYIADTGNHAIRKVNAAGTISTVAGTGAGGYSGDGGPATSAVLRGPQAVAADSAGNLYIADTDNICVRKVDASGVISRFAGQCNSGVIGNSGDGGPAIQAGLSQVKGLFADSAGNLYLADTLNNRVRRINAAGVISAVAGTGAAAFSGDGGPAVSAAFNNPQGVAVDSAGNIWIADTGNRRLRMVSADTGRITTVAGNGAFKFSGDGGPAVSANFNAPEGVAVDGLGNVFVADTGNHRIRKISPSGVVTTMAGTGVPGFSGDGGQGAQAMLNTPKGLTVDTSGNVYIADVRNGRVRRLTPDGRISTFAGGGNQIGDGALATNLVLSLGHALAHDGANLYFFDAYRIRKIGPDGLVRSIAGLNGPPPATNGDGGPAINAPIGRDPGLAVDPAGNLYLTDIYSVRRIDASGIITTVAGNRQIAPDPNSATPAAVAATSTALIQGATNLAADAAGNVAIADSSTVNRVSVLTPGGSFAVLASYNLITNPQGLAIDGAGTLYICDTNNDRIVKIPNALARAVTPSFPANGIVNGASFATDNVVSPWSIASLFGSNLAKQTEAAAAVPLPAQLGASGVLVNGVPAPLFFGSKGQINFQIPVEATGTSASVAVISQGQVTAAATVPLAPAAPGIFTTASSGSGQGAILNQDFQPNGPANPAAAGSVIQIFATGLGATNPPVASGVAANSTSPFNLTTATPVVLINGTPAAVQFSAGAPGFVGLYQVNVTVPSGTPPGTATLQLQSAGRSSNAVTFAVK